MSKSRHKIVTLPTPSPPAAAQPPRLAAQLFVVAGEMVAIAVFAIGIVTVAGWVVAGADLRSRAERHPTPQPREVWRCSHDRYGEVCRPVDRGMPARRSTSIRLNRSPADRCHDLRLVQEVGQREGAPLVLLAEDSHRVSPQVNDHEIGAREGSATARPRLPAAPVTSDAIIEVYIIFPDAWRRGISRCLA